MFIANVFKIAKNWKQPTCLSIDKEINKIWYIYKIEYYFVIKRNMLSRHIKTEIEP